MDSVVMERVIDCMVEEFNVDIFENDENSVVIPYEDFDYEIIEFLYDNFDENEIESEIEYYFKVDDGVKICEMVF